MKNLTKVVALAASLLVSSTYANSHANGLYFGAGIIRSELSGVLKIRGRSYIAKYNKNNYKALIGKRLNNKLAIELQYVNFAKAKLTVYGIISPIEQSGSSLAWLDYII